MITKAFCVIYICVSTFFSAEAFAYTYTEIFVPGVVAAMATAINNHGDIVGYGVGSNGTVSFLDVGGTFTLISFPGAISTEANGINDAGDIVGGYRDASGLHGFKYSARVWSTIDAPAPAVPNTTTLTAINNVGQIAGIATVPVPPNTACCTNGFVITEGTFYFDQAGLNDYDYIYGINDSDLRLNGSGEYVGGYSGQQLPEWPYSSLSGLNKAFTGAFLAVNDGGQVILNGGYLQSSASTTTLGTPIAVPGSSATRASGINNAGDLVGSWRDSGNQTHAFVALGSAPECAINNSSGQIGFSVQDSSGLGQIVVSNSINATTNIPTFVAGTTSPVLVTAVANNPAQSASVTLTATNTSGSSSACSSRISGDSAQWSGLGGILTSNMGLAVDNLRLFAYGIGSDAAVWEIQQNGAGGPWLAWSGLGGAGLVSDPAVITDSGGLDELLVISSDGSLWQLRQTAPFSWSGAAWQTIASGVKGRPAVIMNANGQLQAFVRAADDSLLMLTQSSPGSASWASVSLGGILTSNPAAVLTGSSAEVAVIGVDQALWSISVSSSGAVGSWNWVGASLKGDPDLILFGSSPLVFARGSDDAVWFDARLNSNNWQSLGGQIVNNPRAIVNHDGRAEVFAAGVDNAVWHAAQTYGGDISAPWSQWSSLGGVIIGDVVPAQDASSAVNLFVRGSDSSLWYITQPTPGFWQ